MIVEEPETDAQIEAESDAVAGTILRSRKDTSFERVMKHIHKLTDAQVTEIDAELTAQEHKKLKDAERARRIEARRYKAEYTAASWEIFFKTLTPVGMDGQTKLSWTHKFKDEEETGRSTPTIEEMMRNQCFGIADKTALTNPNEYARKIADAFDRKTFEYTINRADKEFDEFHRWRDSDLRWVEFHWQIRQTRFPPRA